MTPRTITGKFLDFDIRDGSVFRSTISFGECELHLVADPNVPVGTFALTYEDPNEPKGAKPVRKEVDVSRAGNFTLEVLGDEFPGILARNLRLSWDEPPGPHQCPEMKALDFRYALEPDSGGKWILEYRTSNGDWKFVERILPCRPFCPYCGQRLE